MLFLAAWLSAHCRRAAPAVARRASDVPASEMLCVCACLAGGLTEQLSSNSTRYWTASPGSRTSAAHTHAHTATHTHTHTHTHTQTHNIQSERETSRARLTSHRRVTRSNWNVTDQTPGINLDHDPCSTNKRWWPATQPNLQSRNQLLLASLTAVRGLSPSPVPLPFPAYLTSCHTCRLPR